MSFTRRFLHYSPGPTDFVAEIECRAVRGAWFELKKQGGCGDGGLDLADEFTSGNTIEIGDWIAFEYSESTRWYFGQVKQLSRNIPAGVRLKLSGMGSQLAAVFPGGFSPDVGDGVPPHRYGDTDLFSNDPDYSAESFDTVSEPSELVTLLLQQYVVPKTNITLDTSSIEAPLESALVQTLKFRGEESVQAIIADLAVRARGASWGVDENGTFFFLRPKTDLLATYQIGVELASLTETRDWDLIFNRIELSGGYVYDKASDSGEYACGVYRWKGHYFQPASRQTYGDRRITVSVPWIRTQADSREFVREFFRIYAEPSTRYEIEIGSGSTLLKPWDGRIRIKDRQGIELITDSVESVRVKFDHVPSFRFSIGPDDPRKLWPPTRHIDRWPVPGPRDSEFGGDIITFSSELSSSSSSSGSGSLSFDSE